MFVVVPEGFDLTSYSENLDFRNFLSNRHFFQILEEFSILLYEFFQLRMIKQEVHSTPDDVSVNSVSLEIEELKVANEVSDWDYCSYFYAVLCMVFRLTHIG